MNTNDKITLDRFPCGCLRGINDAGLTWCGEPEHHPGARANVAKVARIAFVTNQDAGADWSEDDQESYRNAVELALEEAFPGVDVEVTLGEKTQATVTAEGPEAARIEEETGDTVREIAQEIWNQGDFWPAQDDEPDVDEVQEQEDFAHDGAEFEYLDEGD